MTKLAGNLPTGDRNGLGLIEHKLLNDSLAAHVAVVMISPKTIATDVATGEREATVRIDRIEVIRDVDDVGVLEQIQRRAMEKRLGDTLPLELTDELNEEFGRLTFDVEDLD